MLSSEEKIRIETLAMNYPDWSHKKLAPYLKDTKEGVVYRYLKEKNLLVRNRCPGFFKKPDAATKWIIKRIRLPHDHEHNMPGDLVALDSMVEYIGPHRKKLYFICAIDIATRIGIAVATTKHTAKEAAKVLKLMKQVLGVSIDAVLTDNGSEFLGDFHDACKQEKILHFFSRPRTPKDNAINERFNQTVQKGFYWRCDLTKPVEEINEKLAEWLIEYNCLRVHESLNMRPPVAEYFTTFYKVRLQSQIDLEVYPRLWNRTQAGFC
jgi:transposase InsO family protein